jgi:predicted membrane channel-forming protein YqfA (hemolysin III family)
MLDKNKIKGMVKLSFYEQGKGKEYLKISGYFKNDYVSFNTLLTGLWVTIGFFIIIGVYALVEIDNILAELSLDYMVELAREFVIAYLIVLVIFCVISSIVHRQKHKNAKRHVKNYYRDLGHLEKITKKEKHRS